MKTKLIICNLIVAVFLFTAHGQTANQTASNSSNSAKQSGDAIFDDIMQSLPSNVKAKLDTIPTVKPNSTTRQSKPIDEEKKNEILKNRNEQLNSLPPELKAKVEKAMKDIDKQKHERAMKFKESRKP
jgi:type IV secretory pathway VirB10-like protein